MLGVTGLVAAIRTGRVSVANAIGNGVADDKLIYSYVPDLTRHYLDEDPILPNVDTFRCNEPDALAHVLDRLDEMVVKPVDGSGGKGLVIGPAADGATLDALRERLIADPRGWIAQPVVQLSTVPTLIDGRLAPRHVDLRPFAVNDGTTVRVLPGGLTRVALPEGQLVVNSSQGGGSKDTWVLSNHKGSVNRQHVHPGTTRDRRHDRAGHLAPGLDRPADSNSSSNSSNSSSKGRYATTRRSAPEDGMTHRAEPDRRVAVLDRPLRRARRRDRPHRRRGAAADARGDRPVRGDHRPGHPPGDHGPRPRRGAGRPTPPSATGWSSTTSTPARSPAPGGPPGRTPAGPARRSPPSCGRPSTRPGTVGAASNPTRSPPASWPGSASGPRWSAASPTRR